MLKVVAMEVNSTTVKNKIRQSMPVFRLQGYHKRLTLGTRNMCPGPPSEIRCCVPDATSPLTPKTQEEEPPPDEEPQEPIQSLGGGSELSMLPDTGPLSQDEWGLMQSNFEPAGNLQANLLSEDAFGISFAPSPSFDHTFDPGLFDVASLPATPENEFTAFLDDHQFSQDSFSTQNSLFAMGPDSEENLWNS